MNLTLNYVYKKKQFLIIFFFKSVGLFHFPSLRPSSQFFFMITVFFNCKWFYNSMICIFNLLKFYFHVFFIFCLQILILSLCLCSLLLVVIEEKLKVFSLPVKLSAHFHMFKMLSITFFWFYFFISDFRSEMKQTRTSSTLNRLRLNRKNSLNIKYLQQSVIITY